MIYEVKCTGFEVLNNIKNANLKGNEFRIYHYLVAGADRKTGECMRLLGTISAETGLHKDTVRRVIKKLVAKDMVLMQMRKNQYNNENASNIYTISAMLTDDALALKKEFIKKYPTIKIGVDVISDLVSKTMESMSKSVEVPQETENEIEEEVIQETVVEDVVEEEVVETAYERFAREQREQMLVEFDETDTEIVMLGRKYGLDLTKEQARRLHTYYTVTNIESAFARADIHNKHTYFYVNQLLEKQEQERVERCMEFIPHFDLVK